MTDQRRHLTTEDLAGGTPAERDSLVPHQSEREPVEQTPADRDVLEPDLTDQERLDREPAAHDESGTHQDRAVDQDAAHQDQAAPQDRAAHQHQGRSDHQEHGEQAGFEDRSGFGDPVGREEPVELSAVSTTPGDAPLFTTDDAADYQAEWRALQTDFVDDPREAVQRADELVAQVMQTLAATFNEHKHALEEQWHRGDEVQTEELRQALKRYRSFFDRLLSV
jgi:hypothetical protein